MAATHSKDVTDVARCFTGWTIEGLRQGKPEFAFLDRIHDPGDKTVLGHEIDGRGRQEGKPDLRPTAGAGVARGFEDMYAGAVKDVLHGTGQETFEAIEFLKRADPGRYTPGPGAQYPRGRYGESVKQVAQLLKADAGVEMAFIEVGGWDHHAAEGGIQGQLAQRLRELGQALAAFQRDMGARMQDVVVVTLTEFGRTARENGNRGTDHGHASVSFVMGGGVRGGTVHGRWPALAPEKLYEGRDLALTTDFRDLLGELLARHLGVTELSRVFPGHDTSVSRFPGVLRA